ncbi:MAG: glycosyltransferase [Clostridia bacterium]|nr:glycosyltransferase [Clostridia bacterium]
MDLISVIVPVYNVEKYLDTCIESIVSQTYDNLEIILVDDGSTDNCPAMCDEWALKDPRVKVIHKENGGQGEARNLGIDAAAGDYIGFVDSDDVISPVMYERLLNALTENGADFIQCAMVKFGTYPFKGFDSAGAVVNRPRVLTNGEAVKALIAEGAITSTCPSVLLKAETAKKVRFDSGVINEDVMWVYRAVRESEKILLTDEVLYAYFQRDGSTMNSAYTEKRFDAIHALSQRALEIKTDFPDLFPLAERSCAGGCMYHYQWLCRLPNTGEYREFRVRLHKMFLSRDLKAVYSVTDLKYKIWYTAFRFMPALTCKVRNLLKIGL